MGRGESGVKVTTLLTLVSMLYLHTKVRAHNGPVTYIKSHSPASLA